ncbi:MAG: hypothetical protein Ta2A_12480 [Treponemataceae bacterium]|nr:MAG: hypothetical protein Ta2A_12480 [Treponemataceae bacterium]
MNDAIKQIAAKVRNLFSIGNFQKRYDDGKLQVKLLNSRIIEKHEAFPYGFYAKAAGGKVLVFCQGGNFDSFEILPVLKADDVTLPKLEEGDTALYTANGGMVILREAGDIEISAKASGKIFLGNAQKDICALFVGLIDEIKAIVTAGSPASQTINPATQTKLEAYKQQIKLLFAEGK